MCRNARLHMQPSKEAKEKLRGEIDPQKHGVSLPKPMCLAVLTEAFGISYKHR